METQLCLKCGQSKPASDFYKSQSTECSDCTKQRVKERTDILKMNPEWVEKERKRGREKYHRLYEGTGRAKPECNKRWIEKYPEKRKANIRCGSMLKQKPFDGAEIHHWSYNEEHWKDIIWLSRKDHNKGHRFLVYDQERKMYRRNDNHELLDMREKHEQFIRLMIETKED